MTKLTAKLFLLVMLSIPTFAGFTSEHLSDIQQEVKNKHFNCVEEHLIHLGNDVYAKTELLFFAIEQDDADMVRLMVSRGASLSIPNIDGLQPMEYAREIGSIYALAELIVITA